MHYFVLASDYDGTLATDGQVHDETIAALERLKDSGRKLILVTGRELEDLLRVFPKVDLFDCIVAENGALLYWPSSREEKLLGERPPEEFVKILRDRNVNPLSVGRVIVATWHPNETTVIQTIGELGLELQVIFNKGAVMILPCGINKAAGLKAALEQLKISPHNVVGIGDAENDRSFLNLCDCSVAVANALPMVKERSDIVTNNSRGAGVVELIDKLIASDLEELQTQIKRQDIVLGIKEDGSEVNIKLFGTSILLAGAFGGGKSTLEKAIIEQIAAQNYQFCIFDPQGDYENFENGVVLGDSKWEPSVKEVLDVLENPNQNAVVNLLGMPLKDRAGFFAELLPQLEEMRSRVGRPHWIVVDEAHHLMPASSNPAILTLPEKLNGMLLITVHPEHVAPNALLSIDDIITLGQSPEEKIEEFCKSIAEYAPNMTPQTIEAGEALAWFRTTKQKPFKFRITPGKIEGRPQVRKYAENHLGKDKSFYFRGPHYQLNLRAHNLILFTQIAEGVDDETWLFHLQQNDYSRWIREAIKDESLADETEQIERRAYLSAQESRRLIKAAIKRRYTLPA